MRNVALLLLLAAIGCSPSTPVKTEPSGSSFPGTLETVAVERESTVAVVRDVRAASQEGFDRIVFEFEGSVVPGYRVGYVEPPAVQCGSGEPAEVAGAALLQVQLVPAQAHTEAGEATVRERERRPGLPVLQEMESICDFEADVTWVLGLAARNRFRVQELSGPARLVIDIEHGR